MTWTSPIFPKLYSNDSEVNPFDKPITTDEDSWIGSLINIGAMIGPFPYGFIGEKYGRKIGLLAISIPHIISYLTLAFSRTVYLYYFARLLGGIAVGGGYTLLPMYVAETSGRDALETAREYNLNVGVGGDNRKKGRAEREARYRPQRYSSTPPTIGGAVPSDLTSFPKKKRRRHQQTDNSTRTKKTFCLKRRAGFAKTKKIFFHPGLDRHEAVDVSGDLDFLGDFLGPTVDNEIQAWNLTPHPGVWFFTNLPSGIRKSAPRRLGLAFLDSSSSLTLFGPSTSPHPQKALPRALSCLL
ncbi:hypothetical protein GEV33_012527 [Tenebrio molitor]|uniref:Uncharacterized protein n=1 Tax=Tenebrio molitor TaxID=7067 RepID=A0A8J6L3F2_TENMO|nr:hypothetical protein GEV33_012527 [Tenebrio molitor]